MIPVEGHKHLYRDEKSGAIINTDSLGYSQYKKNRNQRKSQKEEIDGMKKDIEEIKFLLKKITPKQTDYWKYKYIQNPDIVFTLESAATNSATDLTGFTATAQMRKHPGSSSATDFQTSIISATGGRIRVGLTTSQTAALKPGRFMYDVLITDASGEVTRVLEGAVLVREGVTK